MWRPASAGPRWQELAPNREPGCRSRGCRGVLGPVPQPLWIRRAYSVVSGTIAKGPRGVQVLASTHLHWWICLLLHRALAVQHLRVEVVGVAQIDVVGRHGVRLGERLQVREHL